ncbi:hypothetical protein HH308_06380 [Gordonia sp. TBRC 11910]|uniref:DUF7572 domain-containing protein n=1 Tax=Gordonia asplenii TaxID=2725283 RepID=A0A848KRW2_9ACTN|nr:hypothetical protein [Gordonia asplenii]NMO00839.1 hypothetical protein [Gordonia asplenii]
MEFITDLPHWVPVTRLYRHGDHHVAVTVLDFWDARGTNVFLCDEQGVAIDADGDPSNGLTALLELEHGTTFEQACQVAIPALEALPGS